MPNWTLEQIAERFREAAETAQKLQGPRSQGYFSVWPGIQRERWEGYAEDEPRHQFPATPEAIDRMEEVERWVLWLDEQQRHLVWLRAKEWSWNEIARRFGCERTTAWRHWRKSLSIVAKHLMQSESPAR